jgi:hypothetical protein
MRIGKLTTTVQEFDDCVVSRVAVGPSSIHGGSTTAEPGLLRLVGAEAEHIDE